MSWWEWPVLVVVAVALLSGLSLWVQARRRAGTVIAVRRGDRPGRRDGR
ncbi:MULTISPECIES: hypothetical protein [Streptomyces]|uniref:Type II toxin-antitoxin system PemK/MazF family toxin n=1 Tax=Streptomyces gibsoniae TaxID=3075529 RepID=A0ABU2TS04_9ACTN|nr:hypothetical protein [Streptomyces sp. DSM 41699]MDT0463739.1 hypothetical protein [Streptomyces sp. DSM 41699]